MSRCSLSAEKGSGRSNWRNSNVISLFIIISVLVSSYIVIQNHSLSVTASYMRVLYLKYSHSVKPFRNAIISNFMA